jgi:lipid A 4'-phosphatase
VKIILSFFVVCIVLASLVLWPQIDLIVSSWFFRSGSGFYLAANPALLALHQLAYFASRLLGVGLVVSLVIVVIQRQPLCGISAKGFVFLLLGLLLAPGLIANTVLKDHWGRARPREVTAFGGSGHFSSALDPQNTEHKNGSFVSGDASFGFYLPAFAYVVPWRLSRRTWMTGVGAGVIFGLDRLAMGAHFLSDVVFAGALMLLVTAGLHAAMFGGQETMRYWRYWMSSK